MLQRLCYGGLRRQRSRHSRSGRGRRGRRRVEPRRTRWIGSIGRTLGRRDGGRPRQRLWRALWRIRVGRDWLVAKVVLSTASARGLGRNRRLRERRDRSNRTRRRGWTCWSHRSRRRNACRCHIDRNVAPGAELGLELFDRGPAYTALGAGIRLRSLRPWGGLRIGMPLASCNRIRHVRRRSRSLGREGLFGQVLDSWRRHGCRRRTRNGRRRHKRGAAQGMDRRPRWFRDFNCLWHFELWSAVDLPDTRCLIRAIPKWPPLGDLRCRRSVLGPGRRCGKRRRSSLAWFGGRSVARMHLSTRNRWSLKSR